MPVLSPPPILPSHLTGYTAGSLGIRTHVHSVSCVRYVPRDALAKGRTRKRDDELLGRLGATRATESPSGGSRLAVVRPSDDCLATAPAWRRGAGEPSRADSAPPPVPGIRTLPGS
eukprot:7521369-Pyramimonas_sp.AAC.1